MNLAMLLTGIVLGWSYLLALPWLLTGDPNPLASTAGYVILVPLLFLLWVIAEGGGSLCPKFTRKRLAWISRNTTSPKLRLFTIGVMLGFPFSIASGIIIALAVGYTVDSYSVWSFAILSIAGLIHVCIFGTSVFAALHFTEAWGRRVYSEHQRQTKAA